MSHKENGEFIDVDEVVLVGSAARIASGQSNALEVADRGTPRLTLEVTAKGGTKPSLLVLIETSNDKTTWRQLGSFTALNDATGTQRRSFPGADRYVRARWIVSGTDPTFTFSVSGDAA